MVQNISDRLSYKQQTKIWKNYICCQIKGERWTRRSKDYLLRSIHEQHLVLLQAMVEGFWILSALPATYMQNSQLTSRVCQLSGISIVWWKKHSGNWFPTSGSLSANAISGNSYIRSPIFMHKVTCQNSCGLKLTYTEPSPQHKPNDIFWC